VAVLASNTDLPSCTNDVLRGYFIFPIAEADIHPILKYCDAAEGAIASFHPRFDYPAGMTCLPRGIFEDGISFGPATTFAKYYLEANRLFIDLIKPITFLTPPLGSNTTAILDKFYNDSINIKPS
jgi:hypothetical protein